MLAKTHGIIELDLCGIDAVFVAVLVNMWVLFEHALESNLAENRSEYSINIAKPIWN